MDDAKLDLIIGPMFSGKTTKLLEVIHKLESENLKYLVVKPKIDDRYDDKNFIVSHNMIKKECQVLSDLNELLDTVDSEIKYILIDEGQFFPNLYKFVLTCLELLNISVVVTGLDGDYLRKPIGEILDLIPISDSVLKLKSKCQLCEKPAIFTHRFVENNNEQVLVGGSETYMPLCRCHYREENSLKKLNTSSV